jgi:TP901 family phage tail tape measure protein
MSAVVISELVSRFSADTSNFDAGMNRVSTSLDAVQDQATDASTWMDTLSAALTKLGTGFGLITAQAATLKTQLSPLSETLEEIGKTLSGNAGGGFAKSLSAAGSSAEGAEEKIHSLTRKVEELNKAMALNGTLKIGGVRPSELTSGGPKRSSALKVEADDRGGKKRLDSLGERVKKTGEALNESISQPLIEAGTHVVHLAADFESSMAKIEALAGVPHDMIQQWSKDILKMSETTGRSPEELAKGMMPIAREHFKGPQAEDILQKSGQMAEVGMGETAENAESVVEVMKAYSQENITASQAASALFSIVKNGNVEMSDLAGNLQQVLVPAAQLGVPVNDVSAAIAALTKAGMSAPTATTALAQFMDTLKNPSAEAKKQIGELGLSIDQLRGMASKDLLGTFFKVISQESHDGLGAVVGSVDQVKSALSGMTENKGEILTSYGQIRTASDQFGAAVATTSQTMGDQFNKTMASLQSAGISLGVALEPAAKAIAEFAKKFADVFSSLPDWAKTGIADVGVALAALGTGFSVFGKVSAGVTALRSALALLIPSLGATAVAEGGVAAAATAADVALLPVIGTVALVAAGIAALAGVVYAGKVAWDHLTGASNDTWQSYREGLQAQKDSTEESIKQNEELQSLITQYRDMQQSYIDLGFNIHVSTVDHQKLADVQDRIAGLAPYLVKGYDAEGHAIIDLTDKTDDLIRKKQQLLDMDSKGESYKSDIADLVELGNKVQNYDQIAAFLKAEGPKSAEFRSGSMGVLSEKDWQSAQALDQIINSKEGRAALQAHRIDLDKDVAPVTASHGLLASQTSTFQALVNPNKIGDAIQALIDLRVKAGEDEEQILKELNTLYDQPGNRGPLGALYAAGHDIRQGWMKDGDSGPGGITFHAPQDEPHMNKHLMDALRTAGKELGDSIYIYASKSDHDKYAHEKGHYFKGADGKDVLSRHGNYDATDITSLRGKSVKSGAGYDLAEDFVQKLVQKGYELNVPEGPTHPKVVQWGGQFGNSHIHVSDTTGDAHYNGMAKAQSEGESYLGSLQSQIDREVGATAVEKAQHFLDAHKKIVGELRAEIMRAAKEKDLYADTQKVEAVKQKVAELGAQIKLTNQYGTEATEADKLRFKAENDGGTGELRNQELLLAGKQRQFEFATALARLHEQEQLAQMTPDQKRYAEAAGGPSSWNKMGWLPKTIIRASVDKADNDSSTEKFGEEADLANAKLKALADHNDLLAFAIEKTHKPLKTMAELAKAVQTVLENLFNSDKASQTNEGLKKLGEDVDAATAKLAGLKDKTGFTSFALEKYHDLFGEWPKDINSIDPAKLKQIQTIYDADKAKADEEKKTGIDESFKSTMDNLAAQVDEAHRKMGTMSPKEAFIDEHIKHNEQYDKFSPEQQQQYKDQLGPAFDEIQKAKFYQNSTARIKELNAEIAKYSKQTDAARIATLMGDAADQKMDETQARMILSLEKSVEKLKAWKEQIDQLSGKAATAFSNVLQAAFEKGPKAINLSRLQKSRLGSLNRAGTSVFL